MKKTTKFQNYFNDLQSAEIQLTFQESFEYLCTQFDNDYYKWNVEGLGEAFGFIAKLDEVRPFSLYTLTRKPNSIDEPVEWHIYSKDLVTAKDVFARLQIEENKISWVKE